MVSFTQKSYEFLVSWVGYTDTTWETAAADNCNVPLEKISQYESGLMDHMHKI